MQDTPQYVLGIKKSRYIVPKVSFDLLLLIVFGGLILFIIKQLRVRMNTTLYLLVGGILVIILLIDIVVTYVRASQLRYNFYLDRIEMYDKKIKFIILK